MYWEKEIIWKAKVLPMLLYPAKTFPLTESVVLKMKKILTTVLFKKKENLSYEILTLPREVGGLGFLDLITFLDLKFLQPIFNFSKNISGTSINEDFNKRIGHQIDTSISKILETKIDLTKPIAAIPLEHWRVGIRKIKYYNITKEQLLSYTHHEIYEKIMEKRLQDNHILNDIRWENIFIKSATEQNRLLNWRIAHGILPLRDHSWVQLLAKSNKCPQCLLHVETSIHVFLECPKIVQLIRELSKIIHRTSGKNFQPTKKNIIFMSEDFGEENEKIYFIISKMKVLIWKARNEKIFEDKAINVQELITILRKSVTRKKFYN